MKNYIAKDYRTKDYNTTGYIWTAYGINHKPLEKYKEFFAYNQADAKKYFKLEYGNDSSIYYLMKIKVPKGYGWYPHKKW